MDPMDRLIAFLRKHFGWIPEHPRNLLVTAFFICVAYLVSAALGEHTGAENNSALVFVLAVLFISMFTTGYFYGILASVISVFCINYFFMYPYASFNMTFSGYPMAMLSMSVIALVVSTLTTRVKLQASEAVKREQNTKALYELNQRLNAEKAAIELEAARETIRGNMLRAVSHDLRTPLTSISGAAAVLMESDEMRSERNLSLLQDIKTDADALTAMVENLLSITRIQGEDAHLNKQEEMLEEVAGDAVLTIRRRFPNAKVTMQPAEDIFCLPMDPMLIKQVILNLLENAIRHSGDTEHICLRIFQHDNWGIVEVRDHGKGISPEVSQAIQSGRPMSRRSSGDESRGMGIGLSVCQSIIKAHGGFFAAGNDPEGGAVFRFGLPIKENENG